MTESLPGVTNTIRAVAITLTALFVTGIGAGYCAGRSSVDTSQLEAQMTKQKDSIAVLQRDRALYIGQAAALRIVADTEHKARLAASAHAESLATAAERHRTRRIRIIDSTHVGTTASDTQHVETVTEVPVDVTLQLQLDSMAIESLDVSQATLMRENNTLTLENLKLWQAVASDSLEFRQRDAELETLAKAKAPPRCGAKCGAVLTVVGLAALEIGRRALLAVLHP